MDSLQHIDLLLGEALEQLIETCDVVKNENNIDMRYFLMKIGRIVSEIWELRYKIYEVNPDLKRNFLVEHEVDKERFEDLDELYHIALSAEKRGDLELAIRSYMELLEKSHVGYFRLLAEAGLYRLTITGKHKTYER